MSDRGNILEEFKLVSGIEDDDRAKFFLDAANWELSLALSGFYESGDAEPEMDDLEPEAPPVPALAGPSAGPSTSTGLNPPKPVPVSSRKFGTIRDISGGVSGGTGGAGARDDDSDSDDDKQAFYAGGGVHGGSGQQVLGPPGKKKDPTKMIEEMFKAAKEAGAEEVDPAAPSRKKPSRAFHGQGFRLGQTPDDHQAVGVPLAAAVASAPSEDVVVCLKMWKNGFSVDDGPLRSFDDPANRGFLEAVKRGDIPPELAGNSRGSEVELNLEDHHHEEFVATKKRFEAFAGSGQRLGSPCVGVAPPTPVSSASPVVAAGEVFVSVDETAPTTNLQIRLDDGSRLTARFNHTHAVRDVRGFVLSHRPQLADRNFALMTTFPNKELIDDGVTLADANLLNAVIVVRMKG